MTFWKDKHNWGGGNGGGMFYCLGMVGVFIYYIQQVHSLTDFLLTIVKSLFWPAFLTFRLYGFLGIQL